MPTKMVRIEQDLYERIKAHKREDETFSETIERLIDDWSLLELAGTYTDKETERHRELLRRSEETAIEDHDEMLKRMGIDVDE